MTGRWNPWRALRSRDHLKLEIHPIADEAGGAIYGRMGDTGAIVLSPALGRRERNASLAHELIHDERRVTAPDATEATMQREETMVRAEAARRLVPLDELLEFARSCDEVGNLMAWEVADEFDVPEHVAWRAVQQLQAILLEGELRRAAANHPSRAHRASDRRSPPVTPTSDLHDDVA